MDNYNEVNGLPYDNFAPNVLPRMPSSCCTFSIRNPVATPSPEHRNAKGSANGRRHSHPNDASASSSNPQNNLNSNANKYYQLIVSKFTHHNGIVDTNSINLNTVQEQGSGSGSGSSSGTSTGRGSALHHRRVNKSKYNQPYKSTAAPVTTEPPAPPFTCAVPDHIPTNSVLIPTPPSIQSNNLGGSGSGSGSSSSEESSSSLLINSYEITTTPSVHLRASSSSSLSSSQRPLFTSTTPSPKFVPKPHLVGCAVKVLEWLDHVTDVLFVIGFCIIVFLKGCFIAILRYEIKEMIQKIRMMNGEDPVHTAAMNELIGLTSLYENGDGGEGEELMATGVAGDNTSNTNLDEMESDKFLRKSDGKRGSSGSGGILGLVRDTDDLMGNNVNAAVKRSYYGNHIGTNANNTSAPAAISTKHEIEDDFDSSSALLGRYDSAGRKYRDQNGGRALPRNGNNNSATTLPSSTSAPNPIETIATVNSSAC